MRVPDGDGETLSAYAYCAGDPINYVDEDGAARQDLSERRATDRLVEVKYGDETYKVRYTYQAKDYYLTSSGGNPYGTKGNLATQQQAKAADERYHSRGYQSLPEFYVPSRSTGGVNGSSRLDRVYVRGNEIVIWNQYTPHRHTDPYADRSILNLREWRQDQNVHANIADDPGRFVERVLARGAEQRSPVGGVALAGAGAALANLGALRGVALDGNGRVLLLSADGGSLALPPMRLDDLITIFRSVYVFGESPTVSIDPDPRAVDPRQSPLLIRHGAATARTYVGWVLFEADRIMKSYGQGRDNETGARLHVPLPDYEEVLEAQFNDQSGHRGADGSLWSRFWIVPDRVTRLRSPGRALTLLDIGLRVNAETEVFEGGQLHSAPNAAPSVSARRFADWFTTHYQDLERQVVSPLPHGHGLPFSSVPVFAELRRIALLTAIAENLRDQGVPMPAWMEDYPVAPFPVPTHTRPLATSRERAVSGGVVISTLRGGVNLTAATAAVREETAAPEAQQMSAHIAAAPVLGAVVGHASLRQGARSVEVVALPGTESRTVGAARLEEADLVVPAGGHEGRQLVLQRRYNSFFAPSGELGVGWSLDLPRLESRFRKGSFDGTTLTQQRAFRLRSPLGTYDAAFDRVAMVAELGGEFFVPATSGPALALGLTKEGLATVFLRGGGRLRFDREGYLSERELGGQIELYERDAAHRLTRLAMRSGQQPQVAIRLAYDRLGRLIGAATSVGQRVEYGYDRHGHLALVKGPHAEWRYSWSGSLLTAATGRNGVSAQFRYADNGQLLSERRQEPGKAAVNTAYRLDTRRDCTTWEIARSDAPERPERITYDAAMRPLRHELPDGETIVWQYLADGRTRAELVSPAGQHTVYERGANQAVASLRTPLGSTYRIHYDAAERETELWQDALLLRKRTYLPTGQLGEVRTPSARLQASFLVDGTLKDTLLTPPGPAPGGHDRWILHSYDAAGRVAQIKDESGEDIHIAYHASGEPVRITSKHAEVLYERDREGRPLREDTSWGVHTQNRFSPTGELVATERHVGGASELVKYARGLPVYQRHFDSGEFAARYAEDSRHGLRPVEKRLPNGVTLRYSYSGGGLEKVSVARIMQATFHASKSGQLTEIVWTAAN